MLHCEIMGVPFTAHPIAQGAPHDSPSPTHDRRHAGPDLVLNVQTSYVQQVTRFARHFNKSPEVLGPEGIRAHQVYLTNENKPPPALSSSPSPPFGFSTRFH